MSIERENHQMYATKEAAGTGIGLGAAGTVTGIAGTVMSIIALVNEGKKDRAEIAARNAGMSMAEVMAMMTMMGGGACHHAEPVQVYQPAPCSDNTPVSRFDLKQAELIAEKDAEIGSLKADQQTNDKILALNADVTNRFNGVNGKFDEVYKVLAANAVSAAEAKVHAEYLQKDNDEMKCRMARAEGEISQQAVYNGINTERIGCIQKSVQELRGSVNGFTQTVIPERNVCENKQFDQLIAAIRTATGVGCGC